MKIHLADKIWGRLYGAYGNRSVNRHLVTLSEKWDSVLAEELFWEELHHQDSIYPATFAALPWLVELSPSQGKEFTDTYLFLSHIIYCAYIEGEAGCDGARPKEKYPGLSLEISDHHHSWIPECEWLSAEDQPILLELERWFAEHSTKIARRCLDLVCADPVISAHAVKGFATANRSSRVAWSTQMFVDGETVGLIHHEMGNYDQCDSEIVGLLYPYIHDKNPDLASFMLDYPGCSFVPDDPRQSSLI